MFSDIRKKTGNGAGNGGKMLQILWGHEGREPPPSRGLLAERGLKKQKLGDEGGGCSPVVLPDQVRVGQCR